MSRSSGRPAAGLTGRLTESPGEHVVQFYPADAELAVQVARYLAELEGLWNELGARLPFSLLRGYPASVLAQPDGAGAVRDVCRPHAAVADQRSFPAELNSARSARHYVTGLLDQKAGAPVDAALADDAAIVVTELAANAVLHARSAFTLTVSRSTAGIRIAVRDNLPLPITGDTAAGGTAAAHSAASDLAPFSVLAGHGLSVVAQIASRWSVEPLPDGKVVWAELLPAR